MHLNAFIKIKYETDSVLSKIGEQIIVMVLEGIDNGYCNTE